MSARSHVDVSERRLRPIYDCLDYGNNKKAIQEADKVLKKQKNFPCAKALKGLALLRLGRQPEGVVLLEEVHGQSPTDDPTLQALVICYRELHRLDLIADMYANAHKAKPDSEDILTALFMSYVRLGDYKKQQQTAMSLHRLKPSKNPYYFWAVMSIFMQAITDDKLGMTMFLPLAERMTQKYVSESKIEAEAEVKMYLIILEQSCKYELALDVIKGPLGEKLNSELNFAERESAKYLSKLGRWPEVNAAYKKLLQCEPDQWCFYEEYIRSLFKLLETNWSPEENSLEDPVDSSVDEAVIFLQGQVLFAVNAERPLRAPYLAQLELAFHLIERKAEGYDPTSVGNLPDLFTQYYKKFGDKYCCFNDVKKYLTLLDTEEKDELLERLQAECPPALDSSDESVSSSQGAKALQRHQTLVQFARYSNKHRKLDHAQRHQLIQDLYQRYEKGLDFGARLTATEFQFSDVYISLISHILHGWWEESGDHSFIWNAIILLEGGLKKSSSNFQFKLLLIRLYCLIGAFGPCADIYSGLEIKHIQNDALGYVIANHVGRLGHFSSAGTVYDGMLRFFTMNHKETTEHLISSYKYGSFTQVQEFIKFRERLQNSMQYASATSERLLLDMMHETCSHQKTEEILTFMEIDPEKDRTVWSDLRDNRDLTVMPSWDSPTSMTTEELHKKSFLEEKAWMKVRNLMVRCLSAAVKLGMQSSKSEYDSVQNNVNNGDENKNGPAEVLEQLAEQLTQHIEHCRTVEVPEYPLTGPHRTRMCSFLSLGVGQLFLDGIRCILYVHSLQELGTEKLDEPKELLMKTSLCGRLASLVAAQKAPLLTLNDNKPAFSPQTLENVAHLTETIGFLTVLTGVCHRLLKRLKSGRRNKKKKDLLGSQLVVFACFESLIEGLLKCTDDLRNNVNDTDPFLLADQMQALSISEGEINYVKNDQDLVQEVWKKVEKSFHDSAKEIEIFLDHKTTYLTSLTL